MERDRDKVARVEIGLNAIMFRAVSIKAAVRGDDVVGVIRNILAENLGPEIQQAITDLKNISPVHPDRRRA